MITHNASTHFLHLQKHDEVTKSHTATGWCERLHILIITAGTRARTRSSEICPIHHTVGPIVGCYVSAHWMTAVNTVWSHTQKDDDNADRPAAPDVHNDCAHICLFIVQ